MEKERVIEMFEEVIKKYDKKIELKILDNWDYNENCLAYIKGEEIKLHWSELKDKDADFILYILCHELGHHIHRLEVLEKTVEECNKKMDEFKLKWDGKKVTAEERIIYDMEFESFKKDITNAIEGNKTAIGLYMGAMNKGNEQIANELSLCLINEYKGSSKAKEVISNSEVIKHIGEATKNGFDKFVEEVENVK